MKFIATCHEASISFVRHELHLAEVESTVLGPGVLLAESARLFVEVSSLAQRGDLIFLRHLAPVTEEIVNDCSEPEMLAAALMPLLTGARAPVALQIRLIGFPDTAEKRSIATDLVDRLRAASVVIDRKAPNTIASVVVTPGRSFVGVCAAAETLSSWTGGEVRYRHDERQMVSRAELKLAEAQEVLGFSPPRDAPVLDLGAAPGGWTRILAQQGYRVVAVDPAELDARVLKLRGVVHHKTTADKFMRIKQQHQFGAIVNDMRMEPAESAQVLLDCAPLLQPSGLALMTVKLEKRGVAPTFAELDQTRAILSGSFTLLTARQLFHNRSECTFVLQAR